jgi:hypothetical protein
MAAWTIIMEYFAPAGLQDKKYFKMKSAAAELLQNI